MKRNTLSFLVVALFIITAGMAAQVNAASQEVQKQNLRSVQAQANVSQPIGIALPTDAQILMKGGIARKKLLLLIILVQHTITFLNRKKH